MINGKIIQDSAVEAVLKETSASNASAMAQVNGAIEDLQYKVPTAPETAGAYVLKATVAEDLSVTYAWQAVEA